MRYVNIGSGSKGNSTLVYNNHTILLIDMGLSRKKVVDGLATFGKGLEDINGVFITHRHSDHTKSIHAFSALSDRFYSGDPTLIPQDHQADHVLHPFETKLISTMIVECLPASHDAPCTGFLITDTESGEKLFYMTDTGFVLEKVLNEAKDCDYYILESNYDPAMEMHSDRSNALKQRNLSAQGHLANDQASHYLSLMIGKRTKEIDFAHISQECNDPSIALRCFNEVMIAEFGVIPNIRVKTFAQDSPTKGGDVFQ